MVFWIFIALLVSGYCLYKVHMLELSVKPKAKIEDKQEMLIYTRLKSLIGKTCEMKVTRPMMFIDVLHSMKGTVIDIDEQWVVILEKKGMQYGIRLTMVNDVAQIL